MLPVVALSFALCLGSQAQGLPRPGFALVTRVRKELLAPLFSSFLHVCEQDDV